MFLHDTGAYDPYGLTVPINSQCTLLGPYVVPNYDSTFTAVFTNKPIVTPYRGAGRQHGVFVIERLLDIAARELGIDRAEIRRRNLIPPDAFPYNNEIIYQDFTAALLRQRQLRADPRQGAGADRLRELPQPRSSRGCGRRAATSASASPAMSRAPASALTKAPRSRCRPTARSASRPASAPKGRGISPSSRRSSPTSSASKSRDVDVVTGDTDQFYWGAGTFASRGAVVAGNAVNEAAKVVREKILKLAAEHFECAEEDLEIANGEVSVVGVPGQVGHASASWRIKANPMRGAVQPGTEPGLESTSISDRQAARPRAASMP